MRAKINSHDVIQERRKIRIQPQGGTVEPPKPLLFTDISFESSKMFVNLVKEVISVCLDHVAENCRGAFEKELNLMDCH